MTCHKLLLKLTDSYNFCLWNLTVTVADGDKGLDYQLL